MAIEKGGKQLRTLVMESLAGVEAGLCEHLLADRFANHSRLKTLPVLLGKLVEKGELTVQEGACKRDGEEHNFYVLADQPVDKTDKKKIFDEIQVLTKQISEDKVGPDLAKKSIDDLSQEIFDRCMEIQRRIRGGAWVLREARGQ